MTTLHGRDVELDRIDELLRGSGGRVLVLRGPAGIGKSALLEAAGSRAADRQVLACRGTESEARLAFAGLHQLLRPVLAGADAIPPVQARALRCALGLEATCRPERFLVSLAVLSLLGEAAVRRPLLCAIDDAQWLDDATADVLGFVARRLDSEPVAMLFAMRDGEEARLQSLNLPQLRLTGLDAGAARAVIDDRLSGAVSAEVADWLVDATEGNPLALLEMSRGLTAGQRAGIEPILGPLPISSQLERAFLHRVRRLPPATQSLLLVAATDDSGEVTTVLDAAAGSASPPRRSTPPRARS